MKRRERKFEREKEAEAEKEEERELSSKSPSLLPLFASSKEKTLSLFRPLNRKYTSEMIIFPEQYVPLYEAVKADAYQSDDRKVIVFVSASEADSVAAVRILQVRRGGRWRAGFFFSSSSRALAAFLSLQRATERRRLRRRRTEAGAKGKDGAAIG